MTDTPTEKNPPFETVKYRAFEVPIWKNQDSHGRVRYSTSAASKSYFDKKADAWKRTSTFFGGENHSVAKLYSMADDRIAQLEEADYQASRAALQQAANQPQPDEQQQVA